jgi:CheY-like chemotaxis protein
MIPQSSESALPSERKFRIAVAEDDDAVRTTFVRLIEALGHQAVCAVGNGRELIDRCSLAEIDLVFADFDMPNMDGLELAEQLSATGVPVVLVSGHDELERIVVAKEPVAMVLRKPVTASTLAEVIDRFAGQDRM